MAIINQGELVGKGFNRYFRVGEGNRKIPFGQSRRVRIVGSLIEETGEMHFLPQLLAPIAVSFLTHVPLVEGNIFDIALQKPSLTTAKKRGASTAGVDMDEVWRSQGGNPNFRPKKTGGFKFESTVAEIAKAKRKKRFTDSKRIFYKDHP